MKQDSLSQAVDELISKESDRPSPRQDPQRVQGADPQWLTRVDAQLASMAREHELEKETVATALTEIKAVKDRLLEVDQGARVRALERDKDLTKHTFSELRSDIGSFKKELYQELDEVRSRE